MSLKVGKGRYKKQVYRDFSLHFERKKKFYVQNVKLSDEA
ncbi:hypothetical protein RV02_GL002584 [Enterococcus gilvus]|nr:hypothetical protein RV02_GL002584 [Enterococcus gilvus]